MNTPSPPTTTRAPRTAHPPGLQGWSLIRRLPRLARDPLGSFVDLSRSAADLAFLRIGGAQTYFVNHPDLVEHVFKTNAANYTRGWLLKDLHPLIGDGLLSSEEASWKAKRHRLNPAFYKRHDPEVARPLQEETLALLAGWEDGRVVDVQVEMKRLMLRVMVKAMFSPDAELDADALIRELDVCLQYASLRSNFARRVWQAVTGPLDVPAPGSRRVADALRGIDAVTYQLIDRCRDGTWSSGQVLRLLLEAEGRGEIDARQIRDEINTFWFAGFDTMASVLTWTWYLLARHPEAEAKLHAEVRGVLGDRLPGLDDLGSLPYVQMVVQEAMRLYPPAWAMHRVALDEDELGGYRIPARAHVMICAYTLHRHPAFWDDPDTFQPERFLRDGQVDPTVGYQYLPFGKGPRTCIGRRLALMETQLVVATMAQRVRLLPTTERPPDIIPGIILRARGGVPLRPVRL